MITKKNKNIKSELSKLNRSVYKNVYKQHKCIKTKSVYNSKIVLTKSQNKPGLYI